MLYYEQGKDKNQVISYKMMIKMMKVITATTLNCLNIKVNSKLDDHRHNAAYLQLSLLLQNLPL